VDLSAPEIRVLGCLLEKQRTTPDAYPLTLNALRAACNQSTNRDPIVSYDDDIIRDALRRLGHRRWTRLASGARAPKYRHLLDEALPLSEAERAVMTVLMLRGPQTLGELKQRTDRMHPFGSLDEVSQTLDALAGRRLAERIGRRPGQKEERYRELLGADAEEEAPAPARAPVTAAAEWSPPPAPEPPPPPAPVADDRVERLEREVAALRSELDELKSQLGVA
jgi:uncharacterized protein YceH (UPF0502 family)